MILYLHGFRSSPKSYKASLLAQAMKDRGLDVETSLTVIGSSLGGYYANHLAESWRCRAVVLNPAVYPTRTLPAHIGTHTQFHSDESFIFLPEYIDELAALATGKPAQPQHYYLLACKGDEVLDWRDMADWYAGSHGHILEGGDHGISDFARWLPEVLDFALTPQPDNN